MPLEIIWTKHKTSTNIIVGICEALPDSFCNFYISKNAEDRFWVALPGVDAANINKRLILRDPNVARMFCFDFLNYNTKSILEHQLSEMKRRSSPSIKSIAYYENLLNAIVNKNAEPPPKRPFRKSA